MQWLVSVMSQVHCNVGMLHEGNNEVTSGTSLITIVAFASPDQSLSSGKSDFKACLVSVVKCISRLSLSSITANFENTILVIK